MGLWWGYRRRMSSPSAPEAGGHQPAEQLARGDRLRAELDGTSAEASGHVVVIALERATRDPELLGERVQLVVGLVADEVRPPLAAMRPDRLVDEDHAGSSVPRSST